MSLRAFSTSSCAIHGDSLHAYGKCVPCNGVVRPTTNVKYDRLEKKKAIVRRKALTGRPRSLTLTGAERRVAEAMANGHLNYYDISAVARVHLKSVARLIETAMNRIGVETREQLVGYVREGAAR